MNQFAFWKRSIYPYVLYRVPCYCLTVQKFGVHTPYSCFMCGVSSGSCSVRSGWTALEIWVWRHIPKQVTMWSMCIFSSSFTYLFIYFWKCATLLTVPSAWSSVLMCCGFQRDSCTPPLKVNLFLQNNTADNFDLFVDVQQGHSSSVNGYVNLTCLLTLTFYIWNCLIFLFFIWSTHMQLFFFT